jgi:peptide-methionine (S)-S-oxide reductase
MPKWLKLILTQAIISFEQLLDVFYGIHDPTTLNRQGNDVGTQYRSVIFCQNDTQKQVALNYIQQLTTNKTFAQAIVTQVSDAVPFYEAEAYHQNYFANHPTSRLLPNGGCA